MVSEGEDKTTNYTRCLVSRISTIPQKCSHTEDLLRL